MKLNNQFKLAFIIGLTCVIILGSVIYIERRTILTINENEPFAALAELLKNNSVAAHLWFEEAMDLDADRIPQKDVYKYLDSSVQILNSVLTGGETKLGSFKKTTNPETIEIINQLLLNISELKSSAQQLLKFRMDTYDSRSKDDLDGGVSINHIKQTAEARAFALAFNASYIRVQNDCDKLAAHIKLHFVKDNAMLYRLFGTSIVLIIIVFSAFSFLMYRILKNENSAKEVLMRSEKRFRTMFENAPLGISLVDPATGIIWEANSKYAEIVGRSLEELKNVSWTSISHPDDVPPGLVNTTLLKSGKIDGFKMSKRYIHPDRSIIWADIFITSIVGTNKGLPGLLCIAEDVSDRKKTEAEIIKNQLNFEDAQKMAKIGSWELNAATLELKWSKELYRIYELENQPSEILYEVCQSKFHPDDVNRIKEIISEAAEKGEQFNYEHRILCSSGTIKYVSCIGESIKNATGKVISMKGTVQDITERKEMESLLKKTELNTSLLRHAAQVPGAIYQFQFSPEEGFSVPFISDGIWDLYEVTAEELMQNSEKVFSRIHQDDLEDLMSSIKVSMDTLKNWNYDFRVNLPAKGIKWLRGNAKPEKLINGCILWHGYFADISSRKKSEEILQISKDKLEAVFNGSNDAIMLLTRQGFFDCNIKTIKMFGMSDRKEFINSHPAELSPPLQPDGQDSFIKANKMIEIAYEKQFNRFEWMHRRKNGEDFSVEVSLSAFDYGGERVLQAMVHDITERKKAENKIERSLKEKEVLLKEVHHRVKNNLQIILSIINLQYANITDKKTLDLLRDVQSRIKAMSTIHELLYQTTDFSSINFSEYISSIATSLVYSYSPNSNIKLKLDAGSIFLDLDHAIPCGLIINELLTNALKYAFLNQEKGEVSISLKQTDTLIKLNIGDTGRGFPDNIDYRNTESLGMQLVMTLVQQLGGNIILDNSNGAKYTITFKNKKQVPALFKE